VEGPSLAHLRVLERRGVAQVFDSSDLTAGSNWSEEIARVLAQCDVAILLISPTFLASDYIAGTELPRLLDRHEREGLPIVPILVRPSMWAGLPRIAALNFANDPARPLSSLPQNEVDQVYASVSMQIAGLVQALAESKTSTDAAPVTLETPRGHLFVSHSSIDGDFAELLKLTLERAGHEAWIDSDRLTPGLDWREGIDEAIRNASAVLAVMSPDARASEYVTYEWAYALGCGTKVIPIMLRETTLHPRLATLQYLDFTNRIARPWPRLLDAIAKARS